MASAYEPRDFFQVYEASTATPKYEHISRLFESEQAMFEERWKAANPGKKDPRAAWRTFKGNALKEVMGRHIGEALADANARTGLSLALASINDLKPSIPENDLEEISKAVVTDYGEFGKHLPNIDFVVYDDRTGRLVSIVCCKVTLRERLTIPLHAAAKIREQNPEDNIRLALITPDEDRQLRRRAKTKNYAIVNTDFDATYVLLDRFTETERIHRFSRFGEDLEEWGGGG